MKLLLKSLLSSEVYTFESKLYFSKNFRQISPNSSIGNIDDIVYLPIQAK